MGLDRGTPVVQGIGCLRVEPTRIYSNEVVKLRLFFVATDTAI